ncbi:hypothetical protein L596_024592 [Steinernema carpocapsae]|uniref:COP9 signalosome complex subunit 4 n=1 Tax=Steinernema carpocapsae TaxID=34508 RepID=A0A4U5MH77_STECR|nr:hypothetical protein L596_024592 [Steinernema carpocapsae]
MATALFYDEALNGAEIRNVLASNMDHKDQTERLVSMMKKAANNAEAEESQLVDDLACFAENIVNYEGASMVVSRAVVAALVEEMTPHPPVMDNAVICELGDRLLKIVQPRVISYEEQAASIRMRLAEIYEVQQKYVEAAEMLNSIPMETGQRIYTAEMKFRTYLRIAKMYIQAGDIGQAERNLNRASFLQTAAGSDELNIQYKFLCAEILDRNGKFIDAAQRYYQLSMLPALTRSEKEDCLAKAINCTVLASPSQHKTRLLTALCKDDRCTSLPAFAIIDKMFKEMIIHPGELELFEANLKDYQKKSAGGSSMLQKAIVEQNMLAACQLYKNISFDVLGEMLGIGAEKAEMLACEMIADGRFQATIDQVDGYIYFKDRASGYLDQQVQQTFDQVNKIAEMIFAAHPEWAAQQMANNAASSSS